MRIKKTGSTLRQQAYARKIFGAEGKDKKYIALSVGFSPAVANSPKSKIEDRRGFQNAMAALAAESGNIALQVMAEFKARGVEEFSNKDLVGALNAIGNAWSRFNAPLLQDGRKDGGKQNKLRDVILQQVEHQTIVQGTKVKDMGSTKKKPAPQEEVNLDF